MIDVNVIQYMRSSMIMALLRVVDVHEESLYTSKHSDRVASLSLEIGKKYGLPQSELGVLWRSALLHDIGRTGISSEILLAPRKLKKAEYEKVKKHCEYGKYIVGGVDEFKLEAEIIYQHHENIDGSGYPSGIKGHDIHLFARIIRVADVFDALYVTRVYKRAWSLDEIIDSFKSGSGTVYDSKVLDNFYKCVISGVIDKIYG